jgi:tetratricopeptide (TPR) repeat protein
MNQLGLLFAEKSLHAQAEPLYRRALAIAGAGFGPDHPYVATYLNNLAELLQATNRLAEAEPLMRRALAIDQASFGPDHPTVAIRLNNLAALLTETNRLAEAEPLYRRATRRALGPTIPPLRSASTTSPDCCEPPTGWPRRNRSAVGRWRSPRQALGGTIPPSRRP